VSYALLVGLEGFALNFHIATIFGRKSIFFFFSLLLVEEFFNPWIVDLFNILYGQKKHIKKKRG